MRTLTRSAVAAAAVALLLLMPSGAAAQQPDGFPSYKKCGAFKAGGLRIWVSADRIGCGKARRIQREYWLGRRKDKIIVNGGSGYAGYIKLKKYKGWRCTSGAGAGRCAKGKAVAAYENEAW